MKIFITGATGFVGSHLINELLRRGYDVDALARYVSTRQGRSLVFPELLPSEVNAYYGDIRDETILRDTLRKSKPHIIVHLAAETSVEYAFTHPEEIYEVNFIGLTKLVRAAREVVPNLEKFIFAGSVEQYGNQDMFPIKEDSPLKPTSPYGVAKTAAEIYLQYWHRAFGFPAVLFRSTNTYGRKANHDFVTEHIIYDLLHKDVLEMGAPKPTRDFLYIDDEVEAYVKAIESEGDIFGEPMNTGTGVETSIQSLVDLIKKLMKSHIKAKWNRISHRPYEIDRLVLDVRKIKRMLGWKPKHSLEEGLKKTIEWWRNY